MCPLNRAVIASRISHQIVAPSENTFPLKERILIDTGICTIATLQQNGQTNS
jgi:hypothetical protein